MKRKVQLSIIFILFFGFVFYIANFNFAKFGKSVSEQNSKIPSTWLEKYGITVFGEDDVMADQDGDGLSLLNEYEYRTNPFDSDSDKDGYSDGKEVENGYSPIGEGKMDYDGDGLPDKWEKENGLSVNFNDFDLDSDKDGLVNSSEYAHLTNPMKYDTDDDGFGDFLEIQNGYDPSAPGGTRPEFRIRIEKIGVDAPIIFSGSFLEKSLQEDLKHGVVHYPKTSAPGQTGNMVISGHSSNYAWAEGDYNYIFEKIGNLEAGDLIVVEAKQSNGKIFAYEYAVSFKEVMKPDDKRIFEETEDEGLTLVTCWPLGSNWSRMVVKANLR